MALRINTNVAALNAHKNMVNTDNKLSSSLERLSSGLRINKAADDASGMSIANSLRSQGLGLGQAIQNANDGINIVQTADAALEESINIVNTIKTKSIQAAQDGQTSESRKAIQSDIDKLTEELDMIATTTAFNNQKLLSGAFSNKSFQVGAYSGETVDFSIGSAQSNKLGHTTQSNLSLKNEQAGMVELGIYSNTLDQTFLTEGVNVQYDNSSENSMGAVADAINTLSDKLGITATAVVQTKTEYALQAGITESDFAINGQTIGQIDVQANDANGTLVSAINAKTSAHGVVASVEGGILTLTSADDRAIKVTSTSIDNADTTSGANKVFGGTDMSTLGYVQLNQTGAGEIRINDVGGGNSVALTNGLEVSQNTVTTMESNLADGSRLVSGSTLAAGWTTSQDLKVSNSFDQALSITEDSTLKSGSIIGSGSVLNAGSTFGGSSTIGASGATHITTTGTATIGNGSILLASSVIGKGTVLTGEATTSGTIDIGAGATATIGNGSIIASGSTLGAETVFGGTVTLSGNADYTLTGDGTISNGSELASGTILNVGTVLASGESFTLDAGTSYGTNFVSDGTALTENISLGGAATLTQGDMQIENGSKLGSGSVLLKGTVFDSDDIQAGKDQAITLSQDMTVTENTSLVSQNVFKSGTVFYNNDITLDNATNMTLDADMVLGTGSTIHSGSTMAAGTMFSADNVTITDADDMTLTQDATITIGSNLHDSETLIAAGSTVGALVTATARDIVVDGSAGLTLAAGSTIGTNSVIENGSSLGADITLKNRETVSADSDMLIKADSTLKHGSVLAAGTYLSNDIVASDGQTYTTGTVLGKDITTSGDQVLARDMTLESGSEIAKGSILAAGEKASAGATSELGESNLYRLSDISVLTQEDAQIAITVADSALQGLNSIRSNLGSTQNQLTSTIANITVTKVNVQASESTIRDVDFAAESGNFTKLQILAQAGTFAMSQANASAQNVMSLLQ
ncbi:flagellin [Desulfobacter postgatei]|jgi:flagellin|uniref:flagellin N-terminal helical domain-containing protein n=1 Tax=Desulfobacter postgatei TaxID=2293 RepID=UPI002A362FA8|nr:flagellin [Desulfobacter postgatei]MDX9964134.1 flagellin [Desulfobacter postgatei]